MQVPSAKWEREEEQESESGMEREREREREREKERASLQHSESRKMQSQAIYGERHMGHIKRTEGCLGSSW
jgi:hypothetical protein